MDYHSAVQQLASAGTERIAGRTERLDLIEGLFFWQIWQGVITPSDKPGQPDRIEWQCQQSDFRLWPKADIVMAARNVRFRG
jgi:hypothetical protein